jgi:predicted aspartyl protease
MKTIFWGKIEDFVPFIEASVKNKMLVIKEKGNFSMTVDTGFTGGIALPNKMIKQIGLKPVAYDKFRLGTGKVVALPVFRGKVVVKNKVVETWFIPGDQLIGMEFLYSIGSELTFNFKRNTARLVK